MSLQRRILCVFAVLAAMTGCGGGSSVTPIAGHSPNPGPTSIRSASPSPTPGATSTPNVAAVTAALQSTQSYFATLPHQSLQSDLSALAAQMVSSKAFASATVTYGGITAVAADGTKTLLFADHPEDLGYSTSATVRKRAGLVFCSTGTPNQSALSGPTGHEVALLVNESDQCSFDPSRQVAFGKAFRSVGKASGTTYNVDVLDSSLGNILALSGHQIDYLSIATHGMVVGTSKPYYAFLSTTPFNATTAALYGSDLQAGNIVAAVQLQYPSQTGVLPTWAFTPAFLTAHMGFNPGAIVDNQSCFGQSPATIAGVLSTLQAAGVGRYTGWTKKVMGVDADQTEAFIFDRMLGEQSPSTTGLDAYTEQRTPAQRPFPFDDIAAIMATENRSGALGTGTSQSAEPYTASDWGDADNAGAPPAGDGTKSVWLVSQLASVSSPPVEYGLPSIETMAMSSEGPTRGTLAILGQFPSTAGTVAIADEGSVETLKPITWTSNKITVSLPASGEFSKGLVQVFDANGVGSNIEPLTQWQGTLTYTEGETLSMLNGTSGTGTGGFDLVFDLTFRSDVHPVVPTIDASPQPQNLYFPQVEGNSTATITELDGHFTASYGRPVPVADFSLTAVAPMSIGALPLNRGSGNFYVGATADQPAPCNSGEPGVSGGAGNVFCPLFEYTSTPVGSCVATPETSDLCDEYATFPVEGGIGVSAPTDSDPAPVEFTMDPSTYAITVSTEPEAFTRQFGLGEWPAHGSLAGTIGAPVAAPDAATPASRARAAVSVKHHK
jgi:hypothetical protein